MEQGGIGGARSSLGRKGYLLITGDNLYWLGLRGTYDVTTVSQMRVPLQFLGARTSVYVFGPPSIRDVSGAYTSVDLSNSITCSRD
jgi:hypothetical protein